MVNDRKQYNNSNAEYLNENYTSSYGTLIVNSNATLSLSSGKLSVSSTNPSQIGGVMPKVAPAGKTYKISFDVTMSGVSSVDLQLISDYPSGGIQQDYHATTSNGTHTYTVNAPNGIYRIKFFGIGTGTYTIDNFSIREYETDSVYYTAEVVSANDYSAFGAPLPVRNFRPETEPLVTTIDQDNFFTTGGTQGWAAEGAGTTLSNYYGNLKATTSGGPNKGMKKTFTTVAGKTYRIVFGLNTRGFPMLYVNDKTTGLELFRSSDILIPRDYNFTFTATGTETEIKLLEVIASSNDLLLRYFNFEEVVETNEYAFAFNGKEMDNETYGDRNEYDYGFRIYNPRLAKFLSVDPLTSSYPWYTPYQFAGNKPILAVDLDGLEEAYFHIFYDEVGEVFITKEEAIDIEKQVVPNSMIIVHHMWDGSTSEQFVNDGVVFGGTGMLTTSNLPKSENEGNGFTVAKTKIAASAGIGKEVSLSAISLDNSLNNLYAGKKFVNLSQETILGGAEASAGVSIGTGSFTNLGPYDNPQDIFLNSSGGGAEFNIPIFGALSIGMSAEYGSTANGQGYTINSVGMSFGKGLADIGINTKGSSLPGSLNTGGSTIALTKLAPATLLDSAKMAIRNPADSTSINFMKSFSGNPGKAAELDRQIQNSK